MKLTPEYIVGLVDGEGSFTIHVRDPKSFKKVIRRVKVEPRFYLKLIEKDKEILYELKSYFKCGNVYYQPDKRPNHQNCYRYEVVSRANLIDVIIPFFNKNKLRLKSKQTDFALFKRMMKLIMKKAHFTDFGLKNLYELKQQMH
ncbi:MAG TPA: LAGLIDADG family homing endonuclease [Candidatus Paceibacterota bacterium]